MIQFFILLIFFAEVVLTLNLIGKIIKFDNSVNEFNEVVVNSKYEIRSFFVDLKALFEELNESIVKLSSFIEEQKKEYSIKITKTILFYILLLTLKSKYKKAYIGFELGRNIIAGIKEVNIA